MVYFFVSKQNIHLASDIFSTSGIEKYYETLSSNLMSVHGKNHTGF